MPTDSTLFLGIYTVIYPTSDLPASRDWFSRAFGVEPYFDEPFYVGFSIGGYELGLHPDEGDYPVAYWGTADIDAAVTHLESVAATIRTPPNEVGDGIKVATLTTPDGHVMGVIENPNFHVG